MTIPCVPFVIICCIIAVLIELWVRFICLSVKLGYAVIKAREVTRK